MADKPWNGSPFRFTDAEYARACVLDRGEGSAKQRYGLPVREPSGAVNRRAVHAAAQRIGSVSASPEQKAAAKRKLRALYKRLGDEPPATLKGDDMSKSFQTPYDDTPIVELGPKLWRKQILPFRTINYGGGKLSFDERLGKKIVENHRKRPFEYVPFVIGHTDNPEAGRGEVKGLSLTADGVDALIETNDEGTKMIEANGGKLPVSVRYLEDYSRESDGQNFGPVIGHVAATYTPRMTDMRPWEAVDASQGETPKAVVDLSEEEYADVGGATDEDPDALTDEDRRLIAEVEAEADETDEGEAESGAESEEFEMAEGSKFVLGDSVTFKRGSETVSAQFVRQEGGNAVVEVDGKEQKVPALLLKKAGGNQGGRKPDGKPAGKQMSETESEETMAVDLEERYKNRIAELEAESKANTLELRRQRVERELDEYGRQGVPAAAINLARPLLMDDGSAGELTYTDLSEDGASEKKSARGDLVRAMLEGYPRVELGEKGDASAELSGDEERIRKTEAYAKEHDMSFSEAARYVS